MNTPNPPTLPFRGPPLKTFPLREPRGLLSAQPYILVGSQIIAGLGFALGLAGVFGTLYLWYDANHGRNPSPTAFPLRLFGLCLFLAALSILVWCGLHVLPRYLGPNAARLVLYREGLLYERAGFTVACCWDAFVGIGPVHSPRGRIDGPLLAQPIHSSSVVAQILPPFRGIPLAPFEADWRHGELGGAIRAFAPHLLVVR